jgi:hypothetical protein
VSPAGGGRVAIRTCGATTGFFVLQRCENRARAGCARCQRSICPQHTLFLPGDPGAVCPECYSAARGYVSDPNDPDWAIGYRRSFYWETSSTTGDDTWWMTFNEVDRESFDDDRGEGEWGAGGELDEYGVDADDDGYVDS